MSSRWKKVWVDFWGNKTRTFLTILIITVGTFAVGFTNNMRLYIMESMQSDFLSASPSEATIYVYSINDDMVKLARSVPGVNAAEDKSLIQVSVIRGGERTERIQFRTVKDPARLTLDQLKPVKGESGLPSLGDKQILMEASAISVGYKIGDPVTVELRNGKRRELTLAGYVHDVTTYPFNFTGAIFAYATPETLEWLGSPRMGILALSVSENQTDEVHVKQVAQEVAEKLERAGATVDSVNVVSPGHHFMYDTSQALFFILSILGYLAVILGVFLIVNSIHTMMSQQTRQIGMMKAIGGGNSQIFAMYVVLIFAFGLSAFLIAVPLANSAAKNIGGWLAETYINIYMIPYRAYPQTILQQAFAAFLAPLLAATVLAFRAVRVTVREAINDYGIRGDSDLKEKPVSRLALLFPRPMRLSLRNAFRRKARLILTLFTLTLAGAIFMGVYNLWESLDKSNVDMQGYRLADIEIYFNKYYRYDEIEAIIKSVPGVSYIEGYMEYDGTIVSDDRNDKGTEILFTAPPSASKLIDPIIASGRWLMPGDENAIVIGSRTLEIFPDLKIGDWLTIKVDDKKIRWRVVGVYTNAEFNLPQIFVNYEYLSRLTGYSGRVRVVKVLTQRHDSAFQKTVRDEAVTRFEKSGVQYRGSELGADFIETQESTNNILVYVLLTMDSMIAIVGGLGLMGTMSVNVLERTREIGVMRAVGASSLDIQGIVMAEGIVIGFIGWVFGVFLSFPLTDVLCAGVGMALFNSPMPAVYGVKGAVVWLILSLVLACISSSLPARRASRLTIKDALAYE